MLGNVVGNMFGMVIGNMLGNVVGNMFGVVIGNMLGNVVGKTRGVKNVETRGKKKGVNVLIENPHGTNNC